MTALRCIFPCIVLLACDPSGLEPLGEVDRELAVPTSGGLTIEAELATGQTSQAYVSRRSNHLWTSTLGVSGHAVVCSPSIGDAWTDTATLDSVAPELTYKISFSQSGTYQVWVLARADDKRADSVHLGLDGTWRLTDVALPVGPTFAWKHVGALENVTAGVHRLNVWAREDGLVLDALYVTRGAERPVTAFREAASKIHVEVEAALDPSSQARAVMPPGGAWSLTAGAYGAALTPLLSRWPSADAGLPRLELTVQPAAPGTFKVWVLAGLSADSSARLKLGVRGDAPLTLPVLHDGLIGHFEWLYAGDVALGAGPQVLELTATGPSLVVDAIQLRRDSELPRLHPDDGHELWLRYRRVKSAPRDAEYRALARQLVVGGTSATAAAIRAELDVGLMGLLGAAPPHTTALTETGAIVVGTPGTSPLVQQLGLGAQLDALGDEGFVIRETTIGGAAVVVVASRSEIGALYGTFRLLATMQREDPLSDVADAPAHTQRVLENWVQWSAAKGSYAGASIFKFSQLPGFVHPRYRDLGRALASVGINVVTFGVGGQPDFLRTENLLRLKALADVLRPYGVRIGFAVPFEAPKSVGGLSTYDPLDPAVARFWATRTADVYAAVPDLFGYTVKADSESRPGPQDYGRTPADGANVLAAALRPHGGTVVWRTFVYSGDAGLSNEPDRVKHAYQYFKPYDGRFAPEVVLQVKNGPLDFQVREPVSPLLGRMPSTNLGLELQVHQEYTGEATHLVWLVPQWREVLDFDTNGSAAGGRVKDVLRSSSTKRWLFAGVANIGSDINWTGHPMAAANWYGFARLAWNPDTSAQVIAREWSRMTFGADDILSEHVSRMLLGSWQTYERATLILAPGVVIHADTHQLDLPTRQSFHKADATGVGTDRTSRGTRYAQQYVPEVAARFDDLSTCPEPLLAWFHHVPYRHRLRNGNTVIQEIYDTHHAAADEVAAMSADWRSLQLRVSDLTFGDVQRRLETQLQQTRAWRDHANAFFLNKSGIPDARSR